MRAIGARLARDFPRTNRDYSVSVHPLRESMVSNVRQSMFVLLGAVGLVLVIVCVNVAGLVLIRAIGRGRELAVRVAMGAGRLTLVRSLLIESLVLGLAGGAAGLVLAYWATTAIASIDPSIGVPLLNQTRLDCGGGRVCASRSRCSRRSCSGPCRRGRRARCREIVTRIREEGGSTTSDPKRQRMRSLLIVAETTLAVVLLVGAGLLARSFDRLLSVDLGFSAEAVQTFGISLPDARYAQPLQRQAFVENAADARRGDSERRIRGRRVRLAAVEFPVWHLHFDARRRHAVGRRAGCADAAGAPGHARLLQDDGHSDRQGPRLHAQAIAWARSRSRC